ncbi:MAG: hypothetical protein ACLUVG_16535 [Phocaeicola vulgatus]
MPDDKIPLGFSAPDIPAAPGMHPRCSWHQDLLDSQLDKSKEGADWLELAEMQIRSLSSPEYLAEPENQRRFYLEA